MRIRSGPFPTPIAGVSAARTAETVVAPVVTEPKVETEPMVISMGNTRIELKQGEMAKVVDAMNETVRIFNHTLRFQVGDSNRVVVKVIDTASGEVVREIPAEKILDTFKRMGDALGLLLDWRA